MKSLSHPVSDTRIFHISAHCTLHPVPLSRTSLFLFLSPDPNEVSVPLPFLVITQWIVPFAFECAPSDCVYRSVFSCSDHCTTSFSHFVYKFLLDSTCLVIRILTWTLVQFSLIIRTFQACRLVLRPRFLFHFDLNWDYR